MKLSKLLVLSALWLVGLGAQAAIVNGVRQAPDVKSVEFQTGSADNVFYMYNTTAAKFFTQGNTWGTRACVGPHASAVKMYFVESTAGDGSYSISDFVCIRSTSYSWKGFSAEGAGNAGYCDQSTSWGRPYWNVITTEGNAFRLMNTVPYIENPDSVDLYMGYDEAIQQDFYNAYSGFTDDGQRYPITAELAEGEGHHVDWVLVAPEDYEAVADAFVIYAKAQELKAQLDEAKKDGVDVAAEEQVYLNEAATLEELEAAIAAVKEKVKNAAENTATPDQPKDMTSFILNASYDSGKTNWSGDTPAFGYTAGEFYEKNFNHYQDLTGLPNGVYAVKVKGYFRPGNTVQAYEKWPNGTDLNAKLYAKVGEDSLNVSLVNIFEGSTAEKFGVGTEFGENGTADEGQEHYVPNNMQAGEEYFNQGRYQNTLFIGTDDNKLRIGVKKDDDNFGMNWTMFDQWELSYLGNSADAFAYWIEETKKLLPDYSNLTEMHTDSYLTDYSDLVFNAKASNKAEAIAAIKAIEAAEAALQKNIELWKKFVNVVDEAQELVANSSMYDPEYLVAPEGAESEYLEDWVEYDADDILNDLALTNEELEDLIAKVTDIINEAKKHPISIPADMTKMLTNPNFQERETGWTGFRTQESPLMPVIGGPSDNLCAEAWNTASFDLYQVVENAPVGVYEISVQGFYRYGRGNTAWNAYQDQQVDYVKPGGAPCYVYLNAKATPFQNVFDEKVAVEDNFYSTQTYTDPNNEYIYPDGMISAGEAYSRDMYTQRAYGLVAKAGDEMRIGVKGSSNQLGDSWVIFDNFKLTFWGFEKAEIIAPILQEELAKAKSRASEPMGKGTYAKLAKAIENGEAVVSGDNGQAMFDALNELFNLDAEITASVALLKTVSDANEDLANELDAGYDPEGEAANYYEQIDSRLKNHDIDESEVEDIIKNINRLITKLRLPDVSDASDLAPVDVTKIIRNSDYDDSADGWSGTAPKTWGGTEAPCVEFFSMNYDYYLEYEGMPQGTYEVKVNGYYRAGGWDQDYARVDSAEYSYGYLYAIGQDKAVNSISLKRLASETYETDSSIENWVALKTDTLDAENGIYNYHIVPDRLAPAWQSMYDFSMYQDNSVIVNVGEDGYLRFGVKKEVLLENDWTVIDTWRLYYYGTESEKSPTGDTQDIQTVNQSQPVLVEFFTLDGRKATGMQHGLVIMKQTLGNGTVVVKKIRK